MPYIQTVPNEEAKGLLQKIYAGAITRAGKVFQILRIQSLSPSTLRASLGLYIATMKEESPITRAEREMIAVIVSQTNDCFY